MADSPWLTIIGLGEDGPDGVSTASRETLERAEIVMAPPRHLGLLPPLPAQKISWPVPFSDGLPILLKHRGKQVVVLASGDPFWFGAGSVLARHLNQSEWTAHPGPSTFSLAASRLGWALEHTTHLGLHAVPLTRLRPHLAQGSKIIALLRDGKAVADLAALLISEGFGASTLHIMEALGGPRERLRSATASDFAFDDIGHPVCVAMDVAGGGEALPAASGLPDAFFENDGQITKRPIRALTLSALAPRFGEHLWDIGAGSGSIAIEWLLSHPSVTATSIEPRRDRADRIRQNADKMGADRLQIVTGSAPEALVDLAPPDAVFIGGGLSLEMLDWLTDHLPRGVRIVANAVTLESEALLSAAQARLGGDLLRVELAQSRPLGTKRGWSAAYPVVQWSVRL